SGARSARELAVRMFDSLDIPTDHLPAAKPETIRRYFAGRKHLLVFDSAEGVTPHLRAILKVLLESSGPRVLIASMASVKSPLALTYPLENLAFPPSVTGDEFSVPEYDSCALFIDGLHRVRPTFNPDLSELRDIGEICRFLGGHPLGLILHAQRFRSESLAEIRASMLAKPSSLLLPGLDRSVEISLKTLSVQAIRLLEQVCVFESSWTRIDLQALTGQSMNQLRSPLEEIQESLLIDEVLQENGATQFRVQIHIREWVLKRLRKEGRIDAIRERHLLWLLDKFRKAFSEIRGLEHARHRDSLDGATHELAAAMKFLIDSRTDPADFISSLELSWLYWSQSNRGQTVIDLVKSALEKFREPSLARGRLFSALSIYQTKTGSAGKAVQSIKRAIELASSAPDQQSKMYNNLGGSLWAECRFDEALVAFHRARELAVQTGQWQLLDDHLVGIANSLIDMKRYGEAIPVLDELVERTRDIDEVLKGWSVKICQVQLACGLAQFAEAEALLTELFHMSEAKIKEPSLVGRVHLWNAVVKSATGDPFESLVSVVASRVLLNMLDLRPFKVNEVRLDRLERSALKVLSSHEVVMARLEGQLRVSHLVKST
ncbi:MAG: hypothetical protein IT203_00650, partial [Fimbriimonadaceae bacterium]|nr:hypothetical protein [Fimbriimonadaceae bacterium]